MDVARYREVCVAHTRCKGAAHAVFDGARDDQGDMLRPEAPRAPEAREALGVPRTMTTRLVVGPARWTRSRRWTRRRRRVPTRVPTGRRRPREASEGGGPGRRLPKNAAGEPSDVRRQLDAFLTDATSQEVRTAAPRLAQTHPSVRGAGPRREGRGEGAIRAGGDGEVREPPQGNVGSFRGGVGGASRTRQGRRGRAQGRMRGGAPER